MVIVIRSDLALLLGCIWPRCQRSVTVCFRRRNTSSRRSGLLRWWIDGFLGPMIRGRLCTAVLLHSRGRRTTVEPWVGVAFRPVGLARGLLLGGGSIGIGNSHPRLLRRLLPGQAAGTTRGLHLRRHSPVVILVALILPKIGQRLFVKRQDAHQVLQLARSDHGQAVGGVLGNVVLGQPDCKSELSVSKFVACAAAWSRTQQDGNREERNLSEKHRPIDGGGDWACGIED